METTSPPLTIDIPALIPSFQRSLKAANLSPRTVQSYTEAASQLAEFLVRSGMPTAATSIKREHVESFLVDLQTRFKTATVAVRFRSLQQLFRWMLEDGEIEKSPMERMRPPAVDEAPPAVLTDADLKALLKVCEGGGFAERRDTAILRCFIDTGARLSEIANLTLNDVDLDDQTLTVIGKGSRTRILPIGAKAVRALDRYLRARHTEAPRLWIGAKGGMTPSGIAQMIRRRAVAAGIGHVNPHRFRHTLAHRWLAAGGQEGDLQELAGWKSRQMLARYGASGRAERAREAHARLALGDRL